LGMFVADVLIRNHAVKFGDSHRESFSEPWRKMNYYERNSMNISAGKDIRIFGLKKLFNYHFDLMINTYRKFRYKYQLKWYYPTISDTAFNFVRDWAAYTLLIHKVLSGQIDAATFTIYLGVIANFSQYIYDVSMHFANLRDASHQFNDYHEFMKQKDLFVHSNATADNGTTVSGNATAAPSIEFRNVSFAYEGSEKAVLKDVSFKIGADEKIALVGNNGAGKTTIVKLLCGLYQPTSGEILIDGKSINDIGVEKYQDMISVLFQDTSPIALSIAENVCGCEPKDVDDKRLHECLEKAGLLSKVDSLPKKEETYITQTLDEKGVVLSGGETQKLLLAKAMYKDGPMLILDEPTSALDPIAESKIYEEYNQMASQKTAVFISHRLASTKFCDRILFLDGGQIVEEGTHDQLMEKGGKYREIFDIQSHYYKAEAQDEE
ncbi:MAG: ABC transporter ATP-binding protein, partial [Treponema sp.]|nr:ABC transporter ATP-binding protein [Treponema sp.]